LDSFDKAILRFSPTIDENFDQRSLISINKGLLAFSGGIWSIMSLTKLWMF
jgi:hypothetical protein